MHTVEVHVIMIVLVTSWTIYGKATALLLLILANVC